MTSPFSEELISAYLDGELTAQEQAHVEKHLREDAGLRRMCDELRVLRMTLQSMPTEDLSQDLAERVLRQAERRMLLGEEEVAKEGPAAQQAAVASPAPPPATATIPMRRNWRFIAGCVATAAALFLAAILLLDPSQFAAKTDTVAQGPSAESSSSSAGSLEQPADEQSLAVDGESAKGAPSLSLGALPEEGESVQDNAMPQRSSAGLGVAHDAPRDAFYDGVLLRKEEQAAELAGSGLAGSGSNKARPTEAMPGGAAAAYGATAEEAESFAAGRPSTVASDVNPSTRPRLKSQTPGSGGAASSGSENNRLPTDTAGSRLAGSSPPPPSDVRSADDSYPSSGMGGMLGGSGAALGKQSRDATSGEPTNLNAYEYGATAELRKSLPFSASGAPGPAVHDDASRKMVAQQLVQQLDTKQTLLVQVTLPRELEIRFREAATTPDENQQRLSAAAWELLDAEILPAVELKAPSTRGAQQLRQEVNPGIENVILVDGAPADVRKLVERLASRSDIQVHDSTMASGQTPANSNAVDTLAVDSQSQMSRALITQESPALSGDAPAAIADMTKGETASSDKEEAAGVARSAKALYGIDSAQPGAGNSSDLPNSKTDGDAKKSLDASSLGSRGPASGQSGAASQPVAPPPATNMRRRATEDRGDSAGAAPAGTAAGEKQELEDKATLPQAIADSSEPAAVHAVEMEATPPQPRAVVYFLFRFRTEPATVAPPQPADAAQPPSDDQ